MNAAIALLALAAAPQEAPLPYPAEQVLDAFATACSGAENYAVVEASVEAAEWERFTPAADSVLGRILAFGEKQVYADPEFLPTATRGAQFRKSVAGRELQLVISEVVFEESLARGCRIYDFAAVEPLDADTLGTWAVREPVDATPPDTEGLVKYVWNPGLKPGHMEMSYNFVREGALSGTPIGDLPIRGHTLIAQYLELTD